MSIQKVGISLSLSLAVVDATIDTVGGDSDCVLLDDGLAEAVGNDGTGANSQGSLASLVDLSVESRGSEKGRHLMDGSLQITIVAGNSLVTSDSNWDSSIGGNNVGLNSGGDGLVGDLMGGRDHMGDSVGVAKVAETGIGVASSKGVARVDNRSRHSSLLLLSLPLAVGDTSVQAVGGDSDCVLLDDGLAEAVGNDSTGANSQGSLASLVDLSVEGRGSEKSRHLMDSSLQITIVTGNSLVASDSN